MLDLVWYHARPVTDTQLLSQISANCIICARCAKAAGSTKLANERISCHVDRDSPPTRFPALKNANQGQQKSI